MQKSDSTAAPQNRRLKEAKAQSRPAAAGCARALGRSLDPQTRRKSAKASPNVRGHGFSAPHVPSYACAPHTRGTPAAPCFAAFPGTIWSTPRQPLQNVQVGPSSLQAPSCWQSSRPPDGEALRPQGDSSGAHAQGLLQPGCCISKVPGCGLACCGVGVLRLGTECMRMCVCDMHVCVHVCALGTECVGMLRLGTACVEVFRLGNRVCWGVAFGDRVSWGAGVLR